jgi:hypothetical protein
MITILGNDGLYDEDFYMRTVRVTTTLVEVNVFMTGITNIRIFYVMYLAVHPDFKYHLNTFNDIEANYSTTSLSLVEFLLIYRILSIPIMEISGRL